MPSRLKPFQESVCAGIVARFENVQRLYEGLRGESDEALNAARRRDSAIVLQAPTGAGKTIIAVEAMGRFATGERVLWFWFTPFAGLVEQARMTLAAQAPHLPLLELDSDRRVDAISSGGVFVTTWASVAARTAETRIARTTGDRGLALDALIRLAREDGVRIGCVVDEAHHGFHKAAQAREFFKETLRPDYTLMMTATPRDSDASAFQDSTGYQIGDPADWASVSRHDAVDAKLLKRGVRIVRFIAKDDDVAKLVDFEHLALDECTKMHRAIAQTLRSASIPLTPLMLVQVPDGKRAQEAAREYLVKHLGFSERAVRVHTADEPDPDLLALAQDPTVEVLVFKMAVALGFDAPRAATLAALRGARDSGFGVQVIGRIVRLHPLLQVCRDIPDILEHGFVFLANAESQEGLLLAGEQINALTTHVPEIGTQTVVTVSGDQKQIQVVRSGEPLSLLVDEKGAHWLDRTGNEAESPESGSSLLASVQSALSLIGGDATPSDASGRNAIPTLLLATTQVHRYPRRADGPTFLESELLPPADQDIESRLVDFVSFSDAILASRLKVQTAVRRTEGELFSEGAVREVGSDVFAHLAPQSVAARAQRIMDAIAEANQRELLVRLLDRFRRALVEAGFEPPTDEEELAQQLDMVLARNPQLLREAYKRARHTQIKVVTSPLPTELVSDARLETAERGLFGVYPPDLGENDEHDIAQLLDCSPLVNWWYRNPSRRPESVALYTWDDGVGFYPDFVIGIQDRATPQGIALLEVKGSHLWGLDTEVEKCDATHPKYGRAFMVGRSKGAKVFSFLKRQDKHLVPDVPFAVELMRW